MSAPTRQSSLRVSRTAHKLKVSTPRILFLQTLRPHRHLETSIRQAIGIDAVRVVTPGNAFLTGFIWAAIITGCLTLGAALVPIYYAASIWVFILAVGLCCGVGNLGTILAWRLHLVLALRNARCQAEKLFEDFRPNIIIACNYGALVALQMRTPPVPLILLTPAQGAYARELFLPANRFNLEKFPYVLVCHGSADAEIPFDDSVQLCSRMPEDRCHVISLDTDDPGLEGVLTVEELRGLILHTFHEGWISAFSLTQEQRTKHSIVDVSLLALADVVSFSTVALKRLQASPSELLRETTALSCEGNFLDTTTSRSAFREPGASVTKKAPAVAPAEDKPKRDATGDDILLDVIPP